MLARNHTYLFRFSTVDDRSSFLPSSYYTLFCYCSVGAAAAAVVAVTATVWSKRAIRSRSNVVEYVKTQSEFVCLARSIRAQVLTKHTCWFGRCQESTDDELSALVEMFVFASSSMLRCYNEYDYFFLFSMFKNKLPTKYLSFKFYSFGAISIECNVLNRTHTHHLN